jgi:hypothetical protein
MQKSQATLARWAESCPWLEDRGVRTRLLPGGYDRVITYYSEADLNAIRDTTAGRNKIPSYDGLAHVGEAAKECGVSVRTLRRGYPAYRASQARQGKGRPPVARDMPAKSGDGRALPRSYVPRDFLDWFKEHRRLNAPAGAAAEAGSVTDPISVEEAGTILELSIQGVHSLIHRGLLEAKAARIACKGGYTRKGKVLSRAQVEAHRADQRSKYGPAAEEARLQKARELLRSLLDDGMPHLRTEVVAQAVAQGVRQDLVYRAKKELKVRSEREPLFPAGSGWGPAN